MILTDNKYIVIEAKPERIMEDLWALKTSDVPSLLPSVEFIKAHGQLVGDWLQHLATNMSVIVNTGMLLSPKGFKEAVEETVNSLQALHEKLEAIRKEEICRKVESNERGRWN